MTYTVLDLFSGIGGFSLGLERAGFKTVAFCEIDPFCRRVLAKHWPGVPCHDDVTAREFGEGEADVITGGFPCQDVSLAGRRAGLSGSRSGLYRELVRAICVVRPRYAIVENVAALLGDGMGTVLGDLAEGGVDAEWDCVPASAVGAPHERDRVFIITHARSFGLKGAEPATSPSAGGRRPANSFTENAGDAADSSGEQVGVAGQPRVHRGMEPTDPDAASLGCGQRRSWRPPDSFARVRDEARRNAADPYGARLAFRQGVTRDAWEEFAPAQRDAERDGGQSVWPDEPALSRVDDGIPDWMDRVRATGNTVIPQIVELIGRAILAAENATSPAATGQAA